MTEAIKYPVPPNTVDAELTVAQLIDKMRTGAEFTLDKTIEMLSAKDDFNEHFAIHMSGYTYVVRSESIKEYFAVNPKPNRRISKEEENTILKTQLKLMEAEILKLKGMQIAGKRQAIEVPREPDLPDEADTFEGEALPTDAKRTQDQVRSELADELREKQPFIPAEVAKRGRPRKIL